MAHQTVAEGIDAPHALAVELEDVAVFGILVDAIDIVDSIGVLGGGVEEVAAEAQIALVVAQLAEDGGQDVDLLSHGGGAHAGFFKNEDIKKSPFFKGYRSCGMLSDVLEFTSNATHMQQVCNKDIDMYRTFFSRNTGECPFLI